MATETKFEQFDTTAGDIESYLERMEMHFLAIDLKDTEENATRQKAILLSSMGDEAYRILKDVCFPAKPVEKMYSQIVDQLKQHFQQKRLAVAERFHFNSAQQQTGQTVLKYVAQLEKLSSHCEFTGEQLAQSLRDRFNCGLQSQRKLLAKTYSFEEAMDLAVAEEAAAKDIKEIAGQGTSQVHSIIQAPSLRGAQRGRGLPQRGQAWKQRCDCCGLGSHTRDNCWHKDTTC